MHAAAAEDPHTVRISMDAKATVNLGPFSRGGKSRIPTEAMDHDFQPEARMTPVGILLTETDELFVYGVTSKVTSDCLVDRLQQWWNAVEGRYFKAIRALQKKGTKSAKRHLRKLKRRRARFRKDADHVLSKQIVQAADPGSTIVLENLKDIRTRMKVKRRSPTKRRMHSWPFAALKSKIVYKAEERGCTVVVVDPRHTSQACSRCGHTARNNRRSQSVFMCRVCGYQLNADLNGARNIAAKYRAGGGISPAGGLRNQPIVSTSDSVGREEQAAAFEGVR